MVWQGVSVENARYTRRVRNLKSPPRGDPPRQGRSARDVRGEEYGVARQAVAVSNIGQLGEMLSVAPEIDDSARTSGPTLEYKNPSLEPVFPGVCDELSQRRHLGEARGHLSDEGSDSNLGRRDLDSALLDPKPERLEGEGDLGPPE